MARVQFATVAQYADYTGVPVEPAPVTDAALRDASDTIIDLIVGYAYVQDPDTGLPTDTALAEVLADATIEQARFDADRASDPGMRGVKSASIQGNSWTFTDDEVAARSGDAPAPRAVRVLVRAGVLPIRPLVV